MANVIKPKRSNTASAVPTTGQLASGELAVNMADQKVYINNGTSVVQVGAGNLTGLGDVNVTSPTNNQILKYDSTTSKWINGSGGGGSGDVVGPVSSTDNAITRFDGTTGTLIQNSTVTLDDDGNVINVNSLGLDTTPATVPATVGTMSWDDGDGVPSVLLKGGNTTLQIGTQEYARVYNDSGSTLTRGQVVYIFGAQGNRVSVKLARADVEATSYGTIGLVSETIANGAEGFIIVSGALYKLDTSALTAGATVYLSPTTAGAITTTKPQAPNQLVVLGWVERVHATAGSIYVKIDNGYELDELHDVQINSPVSGNLLIYDATTSPIGVWKNASLTAGTAISVTNGAGSVTINNTGVTSAVAGTGISVSGATGAVTITNTAPDQTVAISAGTGMSVSGTYPNFTVTNTDLGSSQSIFKNFAVAGQSNIVADSNNDTLTVAAGTGISLTTNATTDTLTITNSAPDQTVALSAGTGISVSGVYPNFTITNTSPSSGGTVTSVSGAGGYGGLTLTGTVTSSGSLTLGGTPTGTWPISVSGSAASATTATNQSGGTVNATTGSFSSNLTAGTGVAIDPSNVSGFAAGQITEGSTGFSAPGIVIGSGSGSHGAIVYGSGTMFFGTEAGTDNTMNTRATLSNAGAFNTTGAITQNGSQVLTAGNYNSYAPTLTGGGASGTWSINITGNAGSVTDGVYLSGTQTITGIKYFQSNLGSTSGSLSNPPLQAYASGSNSAFMSFHRGGSYAVNMGLDSDNVLRIGGWSASANRWQLDMSGNQTLAGSMAIGGGFTIDTPGSGYGRFNNWVNLNGFYGFYSGNNNAHIYPNNASYGSWRIVGSRNGWAGFEFDSTNGNTSLMIEANSSTVGFHNNTYGWRLRVVADNAYIYSGSYGGGTERTILHSGNFSSYAYPTSNPNGYTSNTGTVTSVSGTGTVSGLTLSGTVTTSGSLSLGGSLSAAASAITSGTFDKARMPTGSILQVVQTNFTNQTIMYPGNTWTDLTGMNVTITPRSTSSTIKLNITIQGSTNSNCAFRLVRGTTPIALGTASGSRTQSTFTDFYKSGSAWGESYSFTFVDSPATTSATTYKIQVWTYSTGYYFYSNMTYGGSDAFYVMVTPSTIIASEIQG